MQKTFVAYLLYQYSHYASFDCPNKTDAMIITPGEIAVAGQKSKKTEENKHGAVIPGCSVKSETMYWD